MKNRRTLITALGAGALTTPFAALAQQPPAPAGAPGKVWRVGYLGLGSHASSALYETELAQGLRELGYVAGGNLVIDARYADGDLKRLPGLAAELVQLKADLIVAVGNDATLAAQAATATIPIVMPTTSDPAGNGIIQSLARPGGNVTGIADLSAELGPKRLEMLLAMMASPASRPASGPTAGHGADRVAESFSLSAERPYLPPGRATPAAGIGTLPGLRRRRLPDELRRRPARYLPALGDLCGQDFQGPQAGRVAGRAACQI